MERGWMRGLEIDQHYGYSIDRSIKATTTTTITMGV
jgi:hypothetical protein